MDEAGRNSGVFEGVYSDGVTAGSQNLLVSFAIDRLQLRTIEGDPVAEWPYDEITSVEHLHPGEAAQLGIADNPGARLYIRRGDFAGQLIEHLPHMSRRAANKRLYIPLGIVGLVLAAVIGGIWLAGYSVPEAIAHLIPDKVRKGMGTQVIASLSGGRKACSGVEGRRSLDKIVERISAASGHKGQFNVKIMPLGMLNAFAAPGEQIVVSKKLVDFVRSPEELAGVIAHEMGHGIRRHPEAGIVRAVGISAGINIAFGGAPGGIGDIGAMLLQLKYSRSAESEADAIALSTLKKAEIPPKPFASFFVRLEKEHGLFDDDELAKAGDVGAKSAKGKNKGDEISGKKDTVEKRRKRLASYRRLRKSLQLLSTHPSSPQRIAVINNQPDWKTRPLLSKKEWQALRHICDKGT